jgi:endoglycosylceramidase
VTKRGGVLAGTLGIGALLAVAAAATASAAPKPPLAHVGRWLTDAKGRVVILHGLNMVSKVGSYRPEDTGFGADDARFLHRNGFNTVRLGIIYKGLEPQPPGADGDPAYRRGYLRSIGRTEQALAKRKIFSLLDFHQDMFNERFQGEGWPDWQTLDDGLPAQPQTGFPGNYLAMPALQRAYDHFWANDPAQGVPLQEAYARAWRLTARRFGRRPYVAGYDLLNEPWPGSAFPSCLNPAGCPGFDTTLTAFSKRVIAAIREVDPRTLAFYEPNVLFNSSARTSHGDTGDPHAGFSFHVYCLAGGGGFTSPVCAVNEDTVLDNADDHVARTGDASLITEFGASDDLADTRRIIDLADRHMVGWQYWHYCDCDDPTTSGPGVQSLVIDPSKPPTGDNVKRAKLKLLARPYPQAVAGTPESFSFDPDTGVFELAYSTASPGQGGLPRRLRTEVRVPAITYPDGYTARVEGAEVTSRRDAPVLRLKPDRGASDVRVIVEHPATAESKTSTSRD